MTLPFPRWEWVSGFPFTVTDRERHVQTFILRGTEYAAAETLSYHACIQRP